MIRTEKRMRLCAVLLMVNLAFIWGNSMLPGEMSVGFSNWVKELLAKLFSDGGMQSSTGGLLRKVAHFTEFAMLGWLLSWRFGMLQKKPILSFWCGVLAACVDETIQRFVPGRRASILDVGIDTCGVLMGMLLLYFGHTVIKKYHNPMEETNL